MKPWCFRAHANSLLGWEMVHFASLLFRNSSFALGFNSKGKLVRDAEDLTTQVVRDTVVAKAYAPPAQNQAASRAEKLGAFRKATGHLAEA